MYALLHLFPGKLRLLRSSTGISRALHFAPGSLAPVFIWFPTRAMPPERSLEESEPLRDALTAPSIISSALFGFGNKSCRPHVIDGMVAKITSKILVPQMPIATGELFNDVRRGVV